MIPTEAPSALPEGHVVSWYGDDLTGSAAVMEVLATAGLPSVLFMDIPTPDQLAAYASWSGIGIAGTARHRSPQWMEEHLPPIFNFLAGLSAPVAHYKVCSTFDSAPEIGSIGKALELAQPTLAGEWTPLLVAAPPIGRYQSFGNLFAVADGVVHRLDRHPTMSRHPVTPMNEADVRLHLANQTSMPVGLVDAVSLRNGLATQTLQGQLADGTRIVALDLTDDETILEVGRLIWENRGDRLLAIGSQGVEYALVRYWREMGMIEPSTPTVEFGPAERFAAVSASISPVTAAQLEWAGANGFEMLRIDVAAAVDTSRWSLEIDRVSKEALESVDQGGSPIVYTAMGPDDPSVSALESAVEESGTSTAETRERIGDGLGQILDRLISDAGISRCAVVGGDTSGHVTRALGILSLTFVAPMGHGTTGIMRAETETRDRPALEYVLKGGQMGTSNFFGVVRDLSSKT
ncbi:MAG: four-carbon acid sugar kinase family protein [Acidimicrobiia bacterium]|nr:MAG: four-carbon acid sugar kinase family protein [Acidimicrobiia bacterium]